MGDADFLEIKKLPKPTSIPVQKNKSNIGFLIIGIFIGVILMTAFVQLEISPQWVTDQTCNDMIYNESLATYVISIIQETSNMCRTLNVTMIETNSTTYPIWFNYKGTNVSRRYVPVQEACDYYLNQGVQNG